MAEATQFFNKGIHSDSEPVFQPKDTIRYLENFRITNKGENDYANENIERLYWTDNFKPFRALNLVSPLLAHHTSYNLVIGKTYVVVKGQATYGGTIYSPTSINSNEFKVTIGNGTNAIPALGLQL